VQIKHEQSTASGTLPSPQRKSGSRQTILPFPNISQAVGSTRVPTLLHKKRRFCAHELSINLKNHYILFLSARLKTLFYISSQWQLYCFYQYLTFSYMRVREGIIPLLRVQKKVTGQWSPPKCTEGTCVCAIKTAHKTGFKAITLRWIQLHSTFHFEIKFVKIRINKSTVQFFNDEHQVTIYLTFSLWYFKVLCF